MNIEQAYIHGFFKRAAAYGFSEEEAINLLKEAEKPGLWANIRAKRARGEKAAKPGDKDYPDRKQWNKLTKASSTEKNANVIERLRKTTGLLPEHIMAAGTGAISLGALAYQLNKNKSEKKAASSPAWQRSEGKNPEGGLNAKGRASYKKQTGGTLKAPVTESKPTGERAKRRNSFCSRMCGMKRVNTGSKAQSDPDSRINKSLRKWNCKCGECEE
jgi:hypothetical protein